METSRLQATYGHALVTGGAGFIGSHLVTRLLSAGWRVTVIDNFDPYHNADLKRAALNTHANHPRFRLVEADICNRTALQQTVGADQVGPIDAIVHLAALTGEARSLREPAHVFNVNVTGTINILDLAQTQSVNTVLLASTTAVYGHSPAPWIEDDRLIQPLTVSAISKRTTELLGLVYRRLYGLRVISLRLSSIYGPRQREDTVLHRLTRQLMRAQPLAYDRLYPPSFDLLYVDDATEYMLQIIQTPTLTDAVYNVGSGQQVAIGTIIQYLRERLAIKPEFAHEPLHLDQQRQQHVDISLASEQFGLRSHMSIATGIDAFVDWFVATMPFNMFGELSIKVKSPEERFEEMSLHGD